jgi:hypothetical protein
MPDSKQQPDDFASVAKRLQCDEDQDRFEKALGKIAKAKPAAEAKAAKKSKG